MDILTHPDSRLRKKTRPVEEIDDSVTSLVDNMVETMFKAEGMGLAAPQIGKSMAVFVMNFKDDFHIFLNPNILELSEEEEKEDEGCLSVPGVSAELSRPKKVVVEATDLDGNPFKLEREGLAARVIQHEIDHLNGTLYFDKLSEARKSLLLSEYRNKK